MVVLTNVTLFGKFVAKVKKDLTRSRPLVICNYASHLSEKLSSFSVVNF